MQFCKRINRRNLGGVLLVAVLVITAGFAAPRVALAQDSSAETNLFRGDRPEISVTVRDSGGAEIDSPATVRIYRSGVPADQGTTRKGRVFFMLASTGDYTVQVSATGYESSQKDIAIPVALKTEVEFNLKRRAEANETTGVPAGPVLAPKAKEAFEKGLQALGAGKIKDAQKYSSEAMGLAPGHPDVLYLQGVVDLNLRNFADAQEVLEKATQIDPTHARAQAALGMALSDQGKYEEAIPALEKSLELNAADPNWETQYALAQADYRLEKYDDAAKMSRSALAKSSGKAPEIELLVAQSLVATGKYDEAAQALRDYLQNHGDRPDAAKAKRWLDRLVADGKVAKN
ncbi:MAG TPA: tetratricopeptide repeat protein [Candidatus Sulfotelmatobacter sp.]|nr:tetratricopeptide repeat protein [Candidatus Sulfotelmatobacter sp.]